MLVYALSIGADSSLGVLDLRPGSDGAGFGGFPYPSTQSQSQVKVANPLAAEAVIYQQTLQTYLDLGVPWFGLGGLTDRFSFWCNSGFPEAHAMIFDFNQQPQAACYLLVSTFYTHLKGK